jgi:hypothetical protein
MARRVFFSFHYGRDIWRVNQVRNANQFVGAEISGYFDASLWEEAKRTGEAAIRRMIDNALVGTSVTAVLIGSETAGRRYVDYEIAESIKRGNGVFGIRIHHLQDALGYTDPPGLIPSRLVAGGYPVYDWRGRPEDLNSWVEAAYQRAHGSTNRWGL